MNPAEAKAILKYMKENLSDNEKLCKGLKAIKEKIGEDNTNCSIFRKQGLSSILIKCLMSSNECGIKWTLSVLASCLLEKECQFEIGDIGISSLINILKTSKCKAIQQRICILIGQQCTTLESSCITFHKFNACKPIISFLNESETDNEKETAIRTLRCLGNNIYHQKLILQENGIFHVCQHVLSTSSQLREESLKTILHFSKWPSASYFRQLLKGTDNFQHLRKCYELYEDQVKKQVFTILLTVFSHHSSYSSIVEYKTNCEVLDYLCMAKLPFMIVSELQMEQNHKLAETDEFKLIVSLCKFCELNHEWKKFSFNVLPTYHQRTWMQLTDCHGIPLLVSLLSSKRGNLSLLQTIFRGLLGIEYLHSQRIKVLYSCLKAKLLPLLSDIFDEALKETCDTVIKDFRPESCHHFPSKTEPKRSSFDRSLPKEIMDWIPSPENNSPNPSSGNVLGSFHSIPNDSRSPNSSSVGYKQLNNFKFRTGKRICKFNDEKRKRYRSFPDTSSAYKINCSSDSTEFSKERLGKETSVSYQPGYQNISKDTEIWMNILEYIVRLLYQVISFKEDITSICKLFLLKFYYYISKAWFVHPSSVKLLLAIAKNSSSIQPVLDILFIPKLAVDLIQESTLKNCSHCSLINSGINDFLLKLQSFFNHHHQYGQCEVANRLNPSKPDDVKHACLVALPHVVKCPMLLNSFLLDHRGLESLISIFSSTNVDSQMHLYGIASLSSVTFKLMTEYSKKYSICLFCDTNHNATTSHLNLEKKEKKKQLLILTGSKCSNSSIQKCYVEEEVDKNCSFQFADRLIFVNREKVSANNEVLKRMLQGSFSESLEKCVEIKHLNSASMEMVIHFIYGCTCKVFHCQDANVYIELLFIAEMYFIPELQILAMHYLSLVMKPEDIYPFIESKIELLGEELLRHLICSLISKPMAIQSKKKWVDQFLCSHLKDIFVQQVFIGLTRLLSITSSICNCDSFRKYM